MCWFITDTGGALYTNILPVNDALSVLQPLTYHSQALFVARSTRTTTNRNPSRVHSASPSTPEFVPQRLPARLDAARLDSTTKGKKMSKANVRHGRFPLFRSPAVPGGAATTIPGSTNLGTYQVGGFSRFTGLFQTVGSMTLQWQMGVHSGDFQFQVTSSIVVNSGNSLIDVTNYGLYVNFTITAANSQTPDFVLIAEPIR